jgi:Subtilase family/Bacterial Ig domain
MRRFALCAGLVALVALAVGADARPGPTATTEVVLVAARGDATAAARVVRAAGGQVLAQRGRVLQARLPRGAAGGLGRAVSGVGPVHGAWPDQVVSQGVERIGADALQAGGLTGRGVRIAVIDPGFGTAWESKLGKELPPRAQLADARSFDRTTGQGGIAGLNLSGGSTRHGESVAEVTYDIARGATFVYVNYHSELEFAEAVDWLAHGDDGARRADVVVHSNSFLTGPFDGTSEPARAVDRARAAGILWVNSAGNYAGRHWAGDAGDLGRDGFADIGQGGTIPFSLAPGTSMGATLSWRDCTRAGAAVPAQSASFQVVVTDGSAAPYVLAEGARDASRPLSTTSISSTPGGTFWLRVRQPDASLRCSFELFTPGAELGSDAVAASSLPTPGDAAGALAVGAAHWRDDQIAPYSSRGPTDDGRAKPELVAPSSTDVSPGIAMVGTSASAPHVAAAAALLIERARAQALPSDPDTITAQLLAGALDLGPPGPDLASGAGRLRIDLQAPVILATFPAAGDVVSSPAQLRVRATDDGTIGSWGVTIDGASVPVAEDSWSYSWDPRSLPAGVHTAVFRVLDMAGNRSESVVSFTTAPAGG